MVEEWDEPTLLLFFVFFTKKTTNSIGLLVNGQNDKAPNLREKWVYRPAKKTSSGKYGKKTGRMEKSWEDLSKKQPKSNGQIENVPPFFFQRGWAVKKKYCLVLP